MGTVTTGALSKVVGFFVFQSEIHSTEGGGSEVVWFKVSKGKVDIQRSREAGSERV